MFLLCCLVSTGPLQSNHLSVCQWRQALACDSGHGPRESCYYMGCLHRVTLTQILIYVYEYICVYNYTIYLYCVCKSALTTNCKDLMVLNMIFKKPVEVVTKRSSNRFFLPYCDVHRSETDYWRRNKGRAGSIGCSIHPMHWLLIKRTKCLEKFGIHH